MSQPPTTPDAAKSASSSQPASLQLEVALERRFDMTPEALFRLWTDSAMLSRWFGVPLTIDPRVGGEVSIDFGRENDKKGRVVALDAPRYLAFTWIGASGPGGDIGTSTVHVRFQPDGNGTRLSLRHEGFTSAEDFTSHDEGWLVYFELWRMLEHTFSSLPGVPARERVAISETFANAIDPLALVAQWTGVSRERLAPRIEDDGASLLELESSNGRPIAVRWQPCKYGASVAVAEGGLATEDVRKVARAAWEERLSAARATIPGKSR